MFYKGIAGITSMQAMTDEFNKDRVVKNCTGLWGKRKGIPAARVTVNEYFERLDPKSCRKYSRSRFMDWSAAKRFMMRGSEKVAGDRRWDTDILRKPEAA